MYDSNNAIFEPDVTLAAELAADRAGPPTPERELLLAALEDAVRCLLRTCTSTERRSVELYEETCDWFASTATSRLFDFESVCAVLGIDPDYFRRQVFTRRDRARAASRALSDASSDEAV